MLSKEDNELITRVGPGTPMGNVMRRYWMPALLSEEIPAPDSPPVRVRLLGEDLVAFRDSHGRVGLLDEFCPHRLASMFLGRNEEGGLRCVYHGWKFDVHGRCVDMPNEPSTSTFKERVHLTAYPVIEKAGVIWAYLGPEAKRPELPDMEWMRAPSTHLFVSVTHQYSNYLQAIEGGIDTVHSSFLHWNDLTDGSNYRQVDTAPVLDVECTDYGFRYASIRDIGEDRTYTRLYNFVMPFHQIRSSQDAPIPKDIQVRNLGRIAGHMWVPIDDQNTLAFNWMMSPDPAKPLDPEAAVRAEAFRGGGPEGETRIRHRTRANDWLIDREAQRTQTYTGIDGVNTQDLAVQESMGPIVDRSREHLGTTDRAIIVFRQMLVDAAHTVAGGGDPPGVDPATYRDVRPYDKVLRRTETWRNVAERELALHR